MVDRPYNLKLSFFLCGLRPTFEGFAFAANLGTAYKAELLAAAIGLDMAREMDNESNSKIKLSKREMPSYHLTLQFANVYG